jgi:MFS family permease
MYASGVPLGMLVDAKTPRWGVGLGVIFFAVGYYPIAQAYNAGPDSTSMFLLCLYSFFTGCGSCSAFTASIKCAALNYPNARGTATAFPLAAFGLSAFFFSLVALALPHGTYNFLILLASGTVLLPVLGFLFLDVIPQSHTYDSLPQHEQRLHRRPSSDNPRPSTPNSSDDADPKPASEDEDASLLSSPSSTPPNDPYPAASLPPHIAHDLSHPHRDVRGFALLPHPEFWQLFCMLGLMTGIGLMTINNIGNDAQALWKKYAPDTDPAYVEGRQQMHVSIISIGSFTGRLLSGIGSDVLVSRLGRSRFWCLFVSACIFVAAQWTATQVENPNYLVLVSSLTGLAYGMLFGVYPSLVAHTFGVHGLSQNWGTMTLAPVISGNIFNLLYGRIYDGHSVVKEGKLVCEVGKECYSSAYWVTWFSALGAVGLCAWSIWWEWRVHRRKEHGERRVEGHERLA